MSPIPRSWRVVGGMVGPLNTQMAAFVPYFQPLGDIMLQSPRGWLVFLLRVQQAVHADGVDCTIVPAPGRSYNTLHSQELACFWRNCMASPLNTQAVLYIVIVV
jgi:hypothetical protein